MKKTVVNLFVIILAICIPVLLAILGVQSKKYEQLEKDIKQLEKEQERLVEENKQLISEISVLSSSERIEQIAVEQLGMRKASSEEIIRIEIKGE